MKLMDAALMRARQSWCNVIVTTFEVKQIGTHNAHRISGYRAEDDQDFAPSARFGRMTV